MSATTATSSSPTAGPSPAIDPCAVFLLLLNETPAQPKPQPAEPTAPASSAARGHQLDVYA
jgi:hypothetical protein